MAPLKIEWKRDRAEFEVAAGPQAEKAGFASIWYVVEFKNRSITHPKYGRISGYNISFFQKRSEGAPWQYKVDPGTVNPFQVFGGVAQAVKEFLTQRKPAYVWFTADEASRVKLYDRLIDKMLMPGYKAEVSGEGKYTIVRTTEHPRGAPVKLAARYAVATGIT